MKNVNVVGAGDANCRGSRHKRQDAEQLKHFVGRKRINRKVSREKWYGLSGLLWIPLCSESESSEVGYWIFVGDESLICS
jgi:hypothetical protein